MPLTENTHPTEPQRRRFQFSLRGLMVLVFGVAVGLSLACMRTLDWTHGALGAATAWIVLGLMNQILDLWGTFHGRSGLANEERWGWRFAVFWRGCVSCLFVGFYALAASVELRLVDLSEPDDLIAYGAAQLRDGLFFLCLMVVLYSVLPARQTKRPGRWSGLVQLAGAAAGVVLGAIICCNMMWVQFLVAMAVQGIELTQPLRFAPEGVDILPAARAARFFRECLFAFGFGLLTLSLTYGLAKQWSRGRWRRLAWCSLIGVALPISACYLIWLFTVAMARAFPVMIEAQRLWPLHAWVSALLVVLLAVTAATHRAVCLPAEPSRRAELSWRRPEGPYYHERPAVILLLALAIGAQVIVILWIFRVWNLYGVSLGWSEIVQASLCEGRLLLRFLVLFVAGYAWYKLRSHDADPGMIAPSRLPAARFGAVWLAMFLTAVIAVPTIAIFSFAVWFSPWYLVSWP